MSVILRKRKNSDGTTSLLLDVYHSGKRSYEFLKDIKLLKPQSPLDRLENRDRLKLAEQIRNKREQELQGGDYGITPAYKKDIDFIKFFVSYLEVYKKKDKRVMSACLDRFKKFLLEEDITSLTTRQVNEALANRFKEYLEGNLNGETPSNYLKKFKRVLQYGVKRGIFATNPALELTAKRNESIKKDILTFEEIEKLGATHITNTQVKMAFLFSCYTGLRFCDIKQLQWKNIQNGRVNILQQKTSKPVSINIHENAIQLIGKQGNAEDFVFILPSHTNACLKDCGFLV